MHESVLPAHSLKLLDRMAALSDTSLQGWTLAGGTGLAFHFGHRLSEDLDFFRTDAFDARQLHEPLSRLGPYETLQEEAHTLTVLTADTKLSFFSVRDPFLFPGIPHRFFTLADVRDIALMKLTAISGRGSRKDFIDLFFILKQPPFLREYFEWLPRKYPPDRVNTYHILKSLTYFDDAEREPMPEMRVPFRWENSKAFFVREARALVTGPS
jgi:hypothetical protein